MRFIHGGVTAPLGFRASGLSCGIKLSKKKDLALIVSDCRSAAVAAFTTNKIQGHCVPFNRERLRHGQAQAILVNSGNANCLTGSRGKSHCVRLARSVARWLRIHEKQVLIGQTGVIGTPLPVHKILKAIPDLVKGLSRRGSSEAAQAILTTDRNIKELALEISIGNRRIRIGGIAKGAGMIHPTLELGEQRQATMLGFLTTDAHMTLPALRQALERALSHSFNMISVDADQSTNDLVILMANGMAQNPLIREKSRELRLFSKALETLCLELAKLLVKDAEGATKFVEIIVKHAHSPEDAREVARTIASSKLVKCALFGSDPNWGRIAAAVGYSRAAVDPEKLQLKLGSCLVLKGNTRMAQPVSSLNRIFSRKNIRISVDLGLGRYQSTVWTCDLSTHFVRVNSAYQT